ncbi:Fasciclin-like arabinogalactan protein 7 [Dionaea muscipula]
MESRVRVLILMVSFSFSLLVLICCPPVDGKAAAAAAAAASPAPAPAPAAYHVNLTHLLTYAGPFDKFLNYLESSQVLDTLQNQANDTEEGLTLFAPDDGAFSSLKKSTISNLTQYQLKSLCLFHALPHYYSLSDFKNLSQSSITTFAGGQYTLNFTDISGTVHLSSGWSNTKIISSVVSTDPVAVYAISEVLLPEAIYGTNIPPTPAPAPAPEKTPVADSPPEPAEEKSPSSHPSASSSYRIMISMSILSHFGLAIILLI